MAKRLESLGALTHGDRRATESRDLSKYNVDTKYGRQALETTIKSIVGTGGRMVSAEEYSDDFLDGTLCVCVWTGGWMYIVCAYICLCAPSNKCLDSQCTC